MKRRIWTGEEDEKRVRVSWTDEQDWILWLVDPKSVVNWNVVAESVGVRDVKAVKERHKIIHKKREVPKFTSAEDKKIGSLKEEERKDHAFLNRMAQRMKKPKKELEYRYEWLQREEARKRKMVEEEARRKNEEEEAMRKKEEDQEEMGIRLVPYALSSEDEDAGEN